MLIFLKSSRVIDAANEKIGRVVSWALLVAVLICAGNAFIRYSLNISSNAWLEVQWYLFSAMYLMASPYTLRRGEHVRIDVVVGHLSKRVQVWIDLFGFLFFLLPVTTLIVYFAVPYAILSMQNQEISGNAGGLLQWPVKVLIPVGFFLLTLQGISEVIKRIAFLTGQIPAAAFQEEKVTADDEIKALKEANNLI